MNLSLVALALVSSSALAAQTMTSPPLRFGIVAGINSATVRGPDSEDPDRRTAFMAGALLVAPLSSTFALQPEVVYTMKGAKVNDQDFTGTVKLNYMEVPLLLRYDMATASGPHPFIYAGPAIAFRVGCGVELREGATTISEDCANSADQPDFKDTDYGAVVGGGFAFTHMNHTVSLGVRYDHGLTQFSESNNVKHRVLSLVGTFELARRR